MSDSKATEPVKPIDLRKLPPPEPMLVIMDAIADPLPACGYWAFLLPRFPQPLVSMLNDRGLDYRVEPEENYDGVIMRIAPEFPEDD
ncbi:sulfurtransferase TusA family protein [Brachymonas denitrificans]|uniref:Uncharacterized conserved protein n=1 Tax=Brachymonas denitrificans DSM 15123 TaxID=1121117 RepID=A0A1H8I3C6_9BURK|nr:DUF2249 domain-containing protein [Brachymonas denitrificans]SEN62874.1 Uncharacterized conserved protein [Brachymonas denitrificans DSM 15123]